VIPRQPWGVPSQHSTSRPAEHHSTSRSASHYADSHRETPPRPSAKCLSCTRPGNAQCAMRRCKVCCRSHVTSRYRVRETRPPALSTSTLHKHPPDPQHRSCRSRCRLPSPAPPPTRAATSVPRPTARNSSASHRADTVSPIADTVAGSTQRGPRRTSRPWDLTPAVHHDTAHPPCLARVLGASWRGQHDRCPGHSWLGADVADHSTYRLS
jgi:hypothetical protein